MANISISDLSLPGSALLAGSESVIDAMYDLSESELRMTVGGGSCGSYKSKSSKSYKSKKSKSKSGSCGCGHDC